MNQLHSEYETKLNTPTTDTTVTIGIPNTNEAEDKCTENYDSNTYSKHKHNDDINIIPNDSIKLIDLTLGEVVFAEEDEGNLRAAAEDQERAYQAQEEALNLQPFEPPSDNPSILGRAVGIEEYNIEAYGNILSTQTNITTNVNNLGMIMGRSDSTCP